MPVHRTCPRGWLINPMLFHWRKLFFSFQASSNANSVLLKGVTICLLPLLSAGTESDLNMCRTCACSHSLCVLMCASVCCVWKTVFPCCQSSPLVLIIFPPLLHGYLKLNMSSFVKKFHLELKSPKFLTYTFCLNGNLCVNSNLFQEAFLMKVE